MSLGKKIPALINLWSQNPRIEITPFENLKREDLYLCHDKKYIDDIFALKIPNGFKNFREDVPEQELLQCASFYHASREALINNIATSMSAGFHHANYKKPGPYCTFNGLMYSAMKLKEEKLINKVGIMDLDFHYGDGTDDIINILNIEYIEHWGLAKDLSTNILYFFMKLEQALERMRDCDIIFFQAGADMYKHDPKGGLLSKEQMIKRDEIVISFCSQNNIPLVWCLAGGYTELEELCEIHNYTMDITLKYY